MNTNFSVIMHDLLHIFQESKRKSQGEGQTSSGVCSALSRRPSNRKAIEFRSTDWRSQYAFISFFSWVFLFILKNTSLPSYNHIKMLRPSTLWCKQICNSEQYTTWNKSYDLVCNTFKNSISSNENCLRVTKTSKYKTLQLQLQNVYAKK